MDRRNILLRRYLCKRLSDYFSQPADKVVGSIGVVDAFQLQLDRTSSKHNNSHDRKGIEFSSLINEWHWKYKYGRIYNEQKGMWLTPVEVFYPYYSNVFANFVKESIIPLTNLSSSHDGAFEIVELGGGRGTNANALLNHLEECHPRTYDMLRRYTIFDTSSTLHECQTNLLKRSRHAEKVDLINADLINIAEGNSTFLTPSDIPTAVIALELLDNLPHDKIGRCKATGEILQAVLVAPSDISPTNAFECSDYESSYTHNIDTSLNYTETYCTLKDPLLRNILSISPSLFTPTTRPRWIPTVAIGILIQLFKCRPNAIVAFADFDWLPPSDASRTSVEASTAVAADGDPLVTDMEGNDHECYLTSPPDALCDILFPTDFKRLASFFDQYMAASVVLADPLEGNSNQPRRTTSIMKQHIFLKKYGSEEVNKTRCWSGYSPMVDDFGNCSVLVITPQ